MYIDVIRQNFNLSYVLTIISLYQAMAAYCSILRI